MLSAGHGTSDPKRTGEPGVACTHHGGDSLEGEENGNFRHGAYAKSFSEGLLTEEEKERVEMAQEHLETPEGAQAHARFLASIAAEQFRRSGDERFLRRYESICDKFGITPADELTVHHEGLEDAFMSNLRDYHEDDDPS
jgi:hypothetical protein